MYTKTEAAYLILNEYKKPLHIKEIVKIALKRKMITTIGKTPWATLGADLYTENKRRTKRGKELRFSHLDAGIWGLVEWGLVPKEIRLKGKRKPKYTFDTTL